MNPLIFLLLHALSGGNLFGSPAQGQQQGAADPRNAILPIIMHLLSNAGQQQQQGPNTGRGADTRNTMAPPPSPTAGGGGINPIAAQNWWDRYPGTPQTQGYIGALSAMHNPNQGGFNGLAGGEMLTPGMSYESRLANGGM